MCIYSFVCRGTCLRHAQINTHTQADRKSLIYNRFDLSLHTISTTNSPIIFKCLATVMSLMLMPAGSLEMAIASVTMVAAVSRVPCGCSLRV